ncbi:MAG: hypothetical protein M1820_000914 [Bogoriella megaspora]|nr:MAG: hypothetical protein M1820_000914 [Bogoriella megaspora]
MRFLKSFSAVLVSALLATSVLADLHEAIRSDDVPAAIDKRGKDKGKEKKKVHKIGRGPEIDYKTMNKYCYRPYVKKTKKKHGKRDLDERALEPRARPANAIDVPMGSSRGAGNGDGPLFSDGYGTCPGIVVQGTTQVQGGDNRFLAHIECPNMASVRSQYNRLFQKVAEFDVDIHAIYLYTVDTRMSNPEVYYDQDLQGIAHENEQVYQWLLQGLNDAAPGRVRRRFHPWGQVGEATVHDYYNPPQFIPSSQ